MTRIEYLIIAAIALIVAMVAAMAVTGSGIDLNDPRQLCLWKGGVPIQDESGRLVRCDFPVNIYR